MCMHMFIYVCIYVFIYIFTYIDMYIYIYIYRGLATQDSRKVLRCRDHFNPNG